MRLKTLGAAVGAALALGLTACGGAGGQAGVPAASLSSSSGSSGSSSGASGSSSSGSSGGSSSSSSGGSAGRVFSGSAPPAILSLPAGSQGFVRTVDGRMVLYVVPKPAPASPVPLMIVLDYLNGNPTFMANFIYAGAHAAQGVVMAFPAHQGTSWNNGLATNGNPQLDIDFLTDVIADATTNLPVDSSKISMTGYSEGGFMADLFGCTKPGLLVGFGLVAAAQLKNTVCETGTPLKMMMIAGTKDTQVPYDGFGQLQPAPTTLSLWEQTDACSGTETATTLPTRVNDGTTVIQHRIPGCAALLYEVVNGGHNWPGSEVTPSTLVLGTTSQNLDATQVQWDFFSGP